MVGDDPHADRGLGILAVALGRDGAGLVDHGLKGVDLPVALVSLYDGSETLETHAGVDRGPRQVPLLDASSLFESLVLHEDEVPDLHEPSCVLTEAPGVGLVVGDEVFLKVPVDLGAGPAGTGGSHGPEVILLAAATDAFVGDTQLAPERRGFVVVLVDGDQEPVLGQAHGLCQKVPG